MSEDLQGRPIAREMTHARAISLAFRWALGFVIVTFFVPLWRLGGGVVIQLFMLILLPLLAAFWIHRSWKVVLWMIPISCALLVFWWFVLLVLFSISAGHPG